METNMTDEIAAAFDGTNFGEAVRWNDGLAVRPMQARQNWGTIWTLAQHCKN